MEDKRFASINNESQDLEDLTLEYKANLMELKKCTISLGSVKLEYVSSLLNWLDQLTIKYPGAQDILKALMDKLFECEEAIENEMKNNLDELLELGDLDA